MEKNWCLLLVFYTIYYACLAGFFAGMLSVHVFLVVPPTSEGPYLTGNHSLLRYKPSLGFMPRFQDDKGTTIGAQVKLDIDKRDSKEYRDYIESSQEFLANATAKKDTQIQCRSDFTRDVDDVKKSCAFDISNLGDCANPEAALLNNKLCIYLKINQVYGWIPKLDSGYSTVGVNCSGLTIADDENLGKAVYSPSMKYKDVFYGSFNHAFFPFLNQVDYTQPLVAVYFPNLRPNVFALVECTLIGVPTIDSARFEIFMGKNALPKKKEE